MPKLRYIFLSFIHLVFSNALQFRISLCNQGSQRAIFCDKGNEHLSSESEHQSVACQRGFAGGTGNDGGEGADDQHPAIGQGVTFFGVGR